MHDAAIFIEVARRMGYSPQAARAALDHIVQQIQIRRLGVGGLQPSSFQLSSFYIFRSEAGRGEPGGAGGRARLVLAFPSADTALSFAQRNRLGPAPRLLRMNVPRILAVVVQHDTISGVLFVDELEDIPPPHLLPPGVRFERAALLNLLKEV